MCDYRQILETERLILRPAGLDDIEAYQSWCGNPKNTRYMSFGPNTEEQTRNGFPAPNPEKTLPLF